jgi:thiol-disulfide isomerase/thioredoxin
MALTESTMLALNTVAPDFSLLDVVTGKRISLDELKSDKGTVIMFICNHCPFVLRVREELIKLALEYKKKGIAFIAINANDADNYPEDSPSRMKEVMQKYGNPFPFLFDETQKTAKAYHAACTPDFYLFDENMKLVYRGQMDDSRPGSKIPVTGKDLRTAIDNLLAHKPIATDQKPSMGCNIKWK